MKARPLCLRQYKFVLALAGLSIFPVTSQASLMIKLDDGINTPILIGDNTTGDLSSATGVNTIIQSLGNWSVNVVSSANTGSTPISPLLNLTSFNVSYTGSGTSTTPLKIFLTDTGYGPTPGLFDLHVGGTQSGGATITSTFFYDTTNTAFGLGNQIAGTTAFTALNYSNEQLAAGPGGIILSPYSLTIEADITNVPSGNFTSQFTSTLSVAAVPLPATIPLLISGLGFMGLFGRRKKSV
jgi:hypothetical protein